MPQGKISDKNTRINITISKDLKSKAELIATKEDRSLSNLVVSLIRKYVNEVLPEGDDE